MDDRLNIPSVTGADLEFDIAGPGGRSYAFVIDWHIRFIVALAWYLVVTFFYLGPADWLDGNASSLSAYFYIAGLPALIVYFFYHPVLEILMDGRTPGKRIAGIRIVTRDGQSPDVLAHLVRNVFRLVDNLPFAYVVGMTTTLLTKNNVRFGDLAAGTLLIYDPIDEKAALKDVANSFGKGIDLREAELVRELVERWDTLDRMARRSLGGKLLERIDSEAVPDSTDDGLRAQLKSHLVEA